MKEKEMKEKLKKINKEFDEVNKHLKEATETTVLECMYAKDDVDKKIDETKKNIEAAKENIKRKQQETHEKFSSHITKIQDDINDLKSKLEEKKELKVGDWVRVKRNLAVHEIGVKYLGKVYRINRISYTGYYLSGTPEGYWYRSSLIPVGNLSRLVEITKQNHEI